MLLNKLLLMELIELIPNAFPKIAKFSIKNPLYLKNDSKPIFVIRDTKSNTKRFDFDWIPTIILTTDQSTKTLNKIINA